MSEQDNIRNQQGDDRISLGAGGKHPGEARIMAYMEGRLSPEEQHEVEAWLNEEGMEGDAIEGLQQLGASGTRQSAQRINHQLRRNIGNHKKKRRGPQSNSTAIVAIGIILLLALVAWVVIKIIS